MGNSKAPDLERSTDESIPDADHDVIVSVGYLLYGVYILGAVVVLINMLIAMMSNTFQEIQVRSTSQNCRVDQVRENG